MNKVSKPQRNLSDVVSLGVFRWSDVQLAVDV